MRRSDARRAFTGYSDTRQPAVSRENRTTSNAGPVLSPTPYQRQVLRWLNGDPGSFITYHWLGPCVLHSSKGQTKRRVKASTLDSMIYHGWLRFIEGNADGSVPSEGRLRLTREGRERATEKTKAYDRISGTQRELLNIMNNVSGVTIEYTGMKRYEMLKGRKVLAVVHHATVASLHRQGLIAPEPKTNIYAITDRGREAIERRKEQS